MASETESQRSIEELIPLLIELQRNLDRELNLQSLAERFGYSPFHFHRLFSSTVGETPRKYIERLRLEKAAYKLAISDETVLDVGLAVGFNNHETFSRAFKRHFGKSPNSVKKEGRDVRTVRAANPRSFRGDECWMSEVKFETLRSMTLLCIRHLGDYYGIPDAFTDADQLWNRLTEWAESNNVDFNPIPLGFFYDNPFLTPKELQRCDACIPIDGVVAGTQTIRCVEFAGGNYGMIEHIGPPSTLAQAFRTLAAEIWASDKYTLQDGPPLEIIRKVHVNADSSVNHIDVYLPVENK